MRYTELGKSGIKVSQIGIGTWQYGSKVWGWGSEYGEKEAIEALRRAIELGINFIDTAEIYGNGISEEVIGKAVRDVRDEVVIASKVWVTNLTYQGVIKACERSLRRLNTSTIDLYQIHWPNPIIPISQTMRAMEKLVEEGKVRCIGVSNFSLSRLKSAQEALKREEIVSDQIKYNLVEREPEKDLVPYAESQGITTIAYSPLAQGALTGKYDTRNVPRDAIRRINILFDRTNLKRLEPLLAELKEIAQRHGKTVAQIALAWLIRRHNVIAIPGAKSPKQAEDNAAAAEVTLSEDELRSIDEIYNTIKLDKALSRIRILFRLLKP